MKASSQRGLLKQHLIDPETCIRCNTCETRCPTKAISHEKNYVVDSEKCNFCMKCVRPCPTGAVDNFCYVTWLYPISQQLGWVELPPDAQRAPPASDVSGAINEARPTLAPIQQSQARERPARVVVSDNYRITAQGAENDVHHVIFDFKESPFSFLEGQNIGLIPPGSDSRGCAHAMRLYSIASARDGEKPNVGNLAIAVKRVVGAKAPGVASNWICDLKPGEEVDIFGPFGSTFLMPEDPEANILMICTGTGVAPFRAFTHRRRRRWPNAGGKLVLIFGARTPDELPYYQPLQKYSQGELHRELVYSRGPMGEREYVQDRLRQRAREVRWFLRQPKSYIYICGVGGLDTFVDEALTEVTFAHGIDWASLKMQLLETARYHVETY